MLKRIDIYLLRQELTGFVATIGIVVILLSLENSQRLWDFVSGTDAPGLLMLRMMGSLVPEYIGVGLPIASFLAPALAIRSLARKGEWQVLSATGLSPWRIMRAPMLLALAAASLQLAIRLDIEPLGERSLDDIGHSIRDGVFGMPINLDEFIEVDERTAVYLTPGASHGVTGSIFVRRGGDVFTARSATASRDATGRVNMELFDGQQLLRQGDDRYAILTFNTYHLSIDTKPTPRAKLSPPQQLDRMGTVALTREARRNVAEDVAGRPALSALMARISSAVFCLILPWLAFVLALPPRRGAGGAGLAIGIGLIVLFLRTAYLVETGGSDHPLLAAAGHMALWLAGTFALVRYGITHEDGAIDRALGSVGKEIVKLVPWRKRALPGETAQVPAASATESLPHSL
ncbi:MAG: LptF/LptG family permease [Sphingomonadales bacterium]|nr:LptF/LptG family permease [Sphingomonadales bacterium]MDE2568507.1 LptF/LptG family permease [Sphingomonadales bacterium]